MEPLRLPQDHEMEQYGSKNSVHIQSISSYQSRDSFSNDRSLLGKGSPRVSQRPRKCEFPHSIRIILRILSLLLSIGIISIIVHTILVYKKDTNISWVYPHGSRLRAFPPVVVMTPTYFMLGAAMMAAILNLFALITLLECFSKIRMTMVSPIAGLGSTAAACGVWVAAMVYFKIWDSKMQTHNDLWSWTCTHKYITIKRPDRTISFNIICQEMSGTFYAGVAIAVLEFINLAALSYNTSVTRKKQYTRVG